MTTWVALLRGINVGGRRRLPMADLRAALEQTGLREVRTYIQSGNVVFETDSPDADESALAGAIAAAIDAASGLDVPVIVRTLDDIERVANAHPDADGDVAPAWLHVFLFDRPAVAGDAPDPDRFLPDRWELDRREMYVTYPSGAGRSKLTIDVVERALGVVATARNVTTLRALVGLGRGD